MIYTILAQAANQAPTTQDRLSSAQSVFERVGDSLFSGESLLILFVSILTALLLGRLTAAILRRVTKFIGRVADRTEDLDRVNRLRRLETLIVLSIATIRTLLLLFAIYFWWIITHENQQSTAILGTGAILTIILSGALINTLRDVASGSVMMAEQWYGVGDHIQIQPFPDAQGIVERVTLRSTKLRKVSGEIMWINNKDIAGISLTPKGVRTIAFELFAKDEDKAAELIEQTNLRLPHGGLGVINPITIMTMSKITDSLWHITAISEVAPGREWLLDKFAIDILKELDEKHKILVHEPISRYADNEAERRFARTINNLRKTSVDRPGAIEKAVKKRAARAKARAKAEEELRINAAQASEEDKSKK
jgi:hypothetical protein